MEGLAKNLMSVLFDYNEETGDLIWKLPSYLKQRKGEAVGFINEKGYKEVCLNHRRYRIHRLVYFMHYGDVPDILDHINNDRTDNRIENLRPADSSQNSYNRKLVGSNKSGIKGVYWSKHNNKWRGQIKVRGKKLHIGYFDTLEEAAVIMKPAREKLHGEFANHG